MLPPELDVLQRQDGSRLDLQRLFHVYVFNLDGDDHTMRTNCECAAAGWCERHKFTKTQREFELCQTDQRFFDLWETGDSPQHRRENSEVQSRCIHRGPQVGEQTCESCGGHVRIKVFSCPKHQECTIGQEVPGAKCCASCDDRDNGAKRFIIHDGLSVGDIAVLTGAVKALKDSFGWRIQVDARTTCAELWENASFLNQLKDDKAKHIRADYDRGTYASINHSSGRPVHQLEAYCESLSREIGETFSVKDWLAPSILLSAAEKSWTSQFQEVTGKPGPFWLVNAGIKADYTSKRWNGFQEVIERTGDRITWVQIGSTEHRHAPLRGAIDLLGKTDLRQLVRLVYHASGVLCGVTGLMHLAHWVERGPLVPFRRHAVIISGGRESPSWFAYPGHHVFHTIGELDCCAEGGCWKSRIRPEEDGDDKDVSLCMHPRGEQGLCMEMIDPALVAQTILRLCR